MFIGIRTKIEETGNGEPADSSDFTPIDELVEFDSGDVEKEVLITIHGDTMHDEKQIRTFVVELYKPTNGEIDSPGSAEVIIYDDDGT